jgi:hypothetical protein
LLALGICTEAEIIAARNGVFISLESAVDQARQHHRNQRRYTLYGIPFEGYPAYLEFPVLAECIGLSGDTSSALAA